MRIKNVELVLFVIGYMLMLSEMMKRIYLDTCVWCRPFDEPSHRVTEEAEAFFKILQSVDEKRYILTKADKIERCGLKVRNPVDLKEGENGNGS